MQNVNNSKIYALVAMVGEPGVAERETAEYMAKRDAWLNKSKEEIEFNNKISRLESKIHMLQAGIGELKFELSKLRNG